MLTLYFTPVAGSMRRTRAARRSPATHQDERGRRMEMSGDPRKIVQIAGVGDTLYALCDDGTVF
jgi:hypothetical protein